jgi:1-acyl-sn-glycerol-3-phosphate acyltransferase
VPLIGWAMSMAKHIAIVRTNRRSQLQTFKDAVKNLKSECVGGGLGIEGEERL